MINLHSSNSVPGVQALCEGGPFVNLVSSAVFRTPAFSRCPERHTREKAWGGWCA